MALSSVSDWRLWCHVSESSLLINIKEPCVIWLFYIKEPCVIWLFYIKEPCVILSSLMSSERVISVAYVNVSPLWMCHVAYANASFLLPSHSHNINIKEPCVIWLFYIKEPCVILPSLMFSKWVISVAYVNASSLCHVALLHMRMRRLYLPWPIQNEGVMPLVWMHHVTYIKEPYHTWLFYVKEPYLLCLCCVNASWHIHNRAISHV